jgi:hypothetical protein
MKISKVVAVKKYFSKFFNASFVLSHALIPLVVLTLYCVLLAHVLPNGINKSFAGETWKLSLSVAVAVDLLAFVLWKFGKGTRLLLGKETEDLVVWDFVLLLLPLTPVVQYILNNQDILSPLTSLYVFGIFAFFAAFFVIVMPKLLGFWGSARTLAILGMAFTFTLTNMPALSRQFAWLEVGSLKIQLGLFGGAFLVGWILDNLNYRKFLYFWIAVYFLSSSFVQAVTPTGNKAGGADISQGSNKLVELVGDRNPSSTPNIYLLIYDAYAHNETMLSYGIDNSVQEEYLAKQGFKLYPHVYSVSAVSTRTMSRVLNASTEFYGNIRRAASGDGVVQNLLKGFGYETYGLFPTDYFFRGYGAHYDFYFPPNVTPSSRLFVEAVLTGAFRFDLEFNRFPHKQYVEKKLNVFKEVSETPRFIDMHTNLPNHSPNSGACRPNETELYKERLDKANLEMRQDLETLITNDPGAIIIVASDHGPYLTKNCYETKGVYSVSEISRLDIQDRYGTFLAIRWPTKDFEKYDDITVLQDLFPSIFGYLFKDKKILEAKIEPVTLCTHIAVSGASVKNGIIYGGINDGEPLFVK